MTSDPTRRHVWIHKLWEQKGIMILNSWYQNTPTQLHKQATNVQGQERPQVCLKIRHPLADAVTLELIKYMRGLIQTSK